MAKASAMKATFEAQIKDLQAKNDAIALEAKRWKDEWISGKQQAGQHMVAEMEKLKLEKVLLIVNHITAGRPNDAIQELLKPLPVVIGMDIRMDDSTYQAARKEIYNKGVQDAITTLTTMITPLAAAKPAAG